MDKLINHGSHGDCTGCDMCLRLIDVLNSGSKSNDVAKGIVTVIKESTGFEAVGLRLLLNDDFPFYCSEGIADEILASEVSIVSSDADGKMIRGESNQPMYECLCGMVLSGKKTDDQCFTEFGGFWTNDLSAFKGGESYLPAVNGRHACSKAGYRSLALLPVKVSGRIIGLLYLGDRRPGLLSETMVGFLERAAASVGVAFVRINQADVIQENLNFTAMLIDVLPIPIFYKGHDGRYLGCNGAFEKLTGLNKNDVLGKTVYDIAAKDVADVYYKQDMELFEGKGVQVYEAVVTRPDGSVRNVIFHKATYSGKDGSVAGLIGGILDITDSKDRVILSQTFHKFAREIVHEINNILLVAKGNSQFMMGQNDDYKDWKQDAEAVFESMGRAEELVKKIRAFNEQTIKSIPRQS